jgi:hypothetical protein
MSPCALWLSMILLIGTGMAVDVPFVFDETSSGVASYNSDQIEKAHISSPDLAGVPTVTQVADNDVLDFPITGGGNIPVGTIEKNVGDLKKTLDAAVEPDNPRVREEALVLALMYPGDLTVDQVCSIYSYLKNGDGSKKGWVAIVTILPSSWQPLWSLWVELPESFSPAIIPKAAMPTLKSISGI